MPDENSNPTEGTGTAAPADDGDEQVTLTKRQVDELYKSARNSAAAELRRAGGFKKQPPAEDPRVARGLELLARYEGAHARAAESAAEIEPLQERTLAALAKVSGERPSKPAAPTTQPASEIGQLLELMKMDIASRMADKLPKPAVQYASPADEIRASINSEVAAIDPNDPQRHQKVQAAVLNRLKNTKVTAAAHNPQSQLTPKKG